MSEPTNFHDYEDLQGALDNHQGTGPGLSESGLSALPASDLDFDEEAQS